jgi:hypothetical protein
MYRSKHFQGLFGEAAFCYRNPGTDAAAGERNVLAGILMRHIIMVRLIGRVYIRGLQHPDRVFPIVKYEDEEPGKVSFWVDQSVREIMMEKKIHGTKVWTLLAQTADGRWAGYHQFGIGNEGHKNLAMEWSTSLSTHIRFHLIGQGFDSSGINNLIKGSIDIQAVKDSAQAVVGKDGRVKSLHQAEAELILSNHDKTQSWVNLELGMTKKQLDDYECEWITQAKMADGQTGDYNFDEAHSVDPMAGRPDDSTAFTKAANLSLGNTAYNVVMDDESEIDELAMDLYKDEKGVNMDLDINQVHQDTGRLHQQNTGTEERTGTASKESRTTLSRQSDSNEGSLRTANSGGSGCTQTLTTGLAKSSLNVNKTFSAQGQEGKQTGVEPLAPAQK